MCEAKIDRVDEIIHAIQIVKERIARGESCVIVIKHSDGVVTTQGFEKEGDLNEWLREHNVERVNGSYLLTRPSGLKYLSKTVF